MFFFLNDPIEDEVASFKYDQLSDMMMNTIVDKKFEDLKDMQEEIKEQQKHDVMASVKE